MTHQDIRKKYVDYFIRHGHKEIPSSPLVPENDPTTLFTSSGMQPLIPYLLGEPHPLGKRLVNSQKSFRSQDIEEVGDNRHTTFFEMLGNWSLGDYFKEEQLLWFYEFLTKELSLPKEKLYISVFEGNKDVPKDTESYNIWKKLGIPGNHIFFYGVKKNWWSRSGVPEAMPPGEPGGPDSEVFFEFTEVKHESQFGEKCHPNCDCGRFLEIGNSVFMQYQKQEDGTLKELPKKNVDFGGGLERLVAATENEPDIFKSSTFKKVIERIQDTTAKQYSDEKNKHSMRIIADHIRASVFLIADGVVPNNKTQGYVLRRLLRRAAVKMHDLQEKTNEADFESISEAIIETYKDVYFQEQSIKKITEIIGLEIFKFSQTLDRALKQFEKLSSSELNGLNAFNFLQSYGFPYELFVERSNQRGYPLNDTERKLHTATHLLQQALRTTLGDQVRQKGSHITAERLRFDFTHPKKLTEDEIKRIEDLVNEKIKANLSVKMQVMPLLDAIKEGALTVPQANYPEKVKVYSMGNFSKEVCGGPHVDFTRTLGSFKIVKEEGVSANTRRVYAVLN